MQRDPLFTTVVDLTGIAVLASLSRPAAVQNPPLSIRANMIYCILVVVGALARLTARHFADVGFCGPFKSATSQRTDRA